MEEKYKIGTISKLLGIPIQTLHYFETCGFVTPSKDSKSNYRYYDAWDVNFLLDSRYLRSFEFSNQEIGEMINRDDFQELNRRFADRERSLLELIQHYQDILDEVHHEKERIGRYQDYLGVLRPEKSPEIFSIHTGRTTISRPWPRAEARCRTSRSGWTACRLSRPPSGFRGLPGFRETGGYRIHLGFLGFHKKGEAAAVNFGRKRIVLPFQTVPVYSF